MSLFNAAREAASNVWSSIMDVVTTPVIGTGGLLLDNTPAALREILSLSPAEEARQQEIIMARRYHEGRHLVKLTTRLKEFLGDDSGAFAVRLNFVQKCNRAIASRLIIESFDSDASAKIEKTQQIELSNRVWKGSRMKAKRAAVNMAAVRDGEHFLLIDWDGENNRPRFTPHQRYTDPRVQIEGEWGEGEGMWMKYPNDDTDQPPLYAVKRWTERVRGARGELAPEPRITIYYPNRAEKYALQDSSWKLIAREPWTRGGKGDTELAGEPLGIPVVHIKTPLLKPAAREAIPIQKGLNKNYVDMLAASDLDAWRLMVAFGWEPEDSEITPGSIIGTTRKPDEASVEVIEAADPGHQIALIDKNIALMADVMDVPLSLIQRSGQRAAEGTLQEEKESFIALVRDYADTMELAYEDAMKIARRLWNVFGQKEGGAPELHEEPEYSVLWGEFWARTTSEKAEEANARLASGYTEEEVQRVVWNEDEKTIARMRRERVGTGFPAPDAALNNQAVSNQNDDENNDDQNRTADSA